jgi:myo-inositol-1-phosphate synthase
MPRTEAPPSLLMLVAGIKGAVGSTVAAAAAALKSAPDMVTPYLTTAGAFSYIGPLQETRVAGWDTNPEPLAGSLARHGVLGTDRISALAPLLSDTSVKPAPDGDMSLESQIDAIRQDIRDMTATRAGALPVLVNLLPAACDSRLQECTSLEDLARNDWRQLPDLAYVVAAVRESVPVVNFTPNAVELPWILEGARRGNVPMAGRDGKTGQTYLKVVLASALRARSLQVDGWYSLNILGNEDGRNLMDPGRCSGKIANKSELLDDILGYRVATADGQSAHKVHIDYYPPRGDAKEAWDVIDFSGLFQMPMSLRLDLQGRDSILAAPMAMDLSRWAAALKLAGVAGAVPDLGFYFKRPVGENAPASFQHQMERLAALKAACDDRCAASAGAHGE